MSIQTYAELQDAVASFLARQDLTEEIKTFIGLAEARMGRELDTRHQEKRATTSTVADDEYIIMPTDLRQVRMVKLNTAPQRVLEYKTPNQLYTDYPNDARGIPVAYTILGTELALRPIPDTVYTLEMIYGEGLDRLSDININNVVLTRHYDAYLYGSLSHAYTYLMDEQRAQVYDGYFDRAMSEIKRDIETSRYGASGLSIKSDYYGA